MSPMPQVLARLPLSDQCYTTWIVHRLLHNTSPPEPTTSGSLPPFPFLLAPFMLLFYSTQTLTTAFLYNSRCLFLHIYLCYLHSNKVAEIFHRGGGGSFQSHSPSCPAAWIKSPGNPCFDPSAIHSHMQPNLFMDPTPLYIWQLHFSSPTYSIALQFPSYRSNFLPIPISPISSLHRLLNTMQWWQVHW